MVPRVISLRKLLEDRTAGAAPELIRHESEGAVRCLACGHRCRVLPGRFGVCRVRFNREGELRVPFGYVSSLGIDPIEKKPFYHVFPGTEALSFGMLGCDYHCSYCQNWITSQTFRDDGAIAEPHFVSPERMVELATEHQCRVLTSTYNEPLITTEWAVEIFKLGRQVGLLGSFVSNGNATPEVLEYLRPYASLYKVDLKAFQPSTYRKLGGSLDTVLDTLRRLRQLDYWVEVVTLIVPGLNDEDDELTAIAEFLAEISTDIPWHVTAFHPDYKMTGTRRTPADTLLRAYEIGRETGLKFVYPGNAPGQVGERENTICPDCGETLITRRGFRVSSNIISEGKCPACRTAIPGVWE